MKTHIAATRALMGAALMALAACAPKPVEAPDGLAITGATIIDVEAGAPIEGRTLILRDGKIAELAEGPAPAGMETLDASGKYLIPGLWDMHVHLFNHNRRAGTNNKDAHFRLHTANGVTRVRDMWSTPEEIAMVHEWQGEVERGDVTGPYVYPASSILDGAPPFAEPGIPDSVIRAGDDATARQAVRDMKAAGADFVKIYWTLSPEAWRAIADETQKTGMGFAGHVPFLVSAFEASERGQASIEHLTGILETCSSREEELRFTPWSAEVDAAMFASFDAGKCRELFGVFAKNDTWNVPTLVLHSGIALYDQNGISDNPDLDYLAPEMVAAWAGSPQLDRVHDAQTRQARFSLLMDLVADMSSAGAGILAGTDNNNPYIVPGFALHDELAIFQEAGLTPAEALRSATILPARFMEADAEAGSIAPGKVADLVILSGDPLTDIRNSRRIEGVVRGGVYFDRAALDVMLAEAATLEREQEAAWQESLAAE